MVFVLVVVAGCAGRHIGSGDAPLEFLQGFTQLLVLVAHAVGALLHFAQAVHELGDEAVQDLGVVPGVGIGAVQLSRALEIARGALPSGQDGAMHLQRAAHGLGRRFQFLARAPATQVGGDHLLHVVAAEGFIGLADGGVGLLGGGFGRGRAVGLAGGPFFNCSTPCPNRTRPRL